MKTTTVLFAGECESARGHEATRERPARLTARERKKLAAAAMRYGMTREGIVPVREFVHTTCVVLLEARLHGEIDHAGYRDGYDAALLALTERVH